MWRCRAVTGLTHPIPPQPRCRPLVILHERHFFNQTSLPQSDQAIIRRWTAEGTFEPAVTRRCFTVTAQAELCCVPLRRHPVQDAAEHE